MSRSPKRPSVTSRVLSEFKKPTMDLTKVDRSTGFLPQTSRAASLERLLDHRDEIEAKVGGPFRLVQVGHWCNTESAREWPIFIGFHGSKARGKKNTNEQSDRFAKWCFVFDCIEGSENINSDQQEPCFTFEQVADWDSQVQDFAPKETLTPFCKAIGFARLRSRAYSTRAFHIVPYAHHAIHRRPSTISQIWSVHIAMPIHELPSTFTVNGEQQTASNFFERGIQQQPPRTDIYWLPRNEDNHCSVSSEAAMLLNGPHVEHVAKKEVVKEVVKVDSYILDSTPSFRIDFPDGRSLNVDPDFFRKMFV